MKRTSILVILASTLVLALFIAPKPAVSSANGEIYTVNETPFQVWITIYNLGRTQQIDYGMVEPRATRRWANCCYSAGSYYYVRGEVLEKGKKIDDTTIQVVPKLCGKDNSLGYRYVYGYARVVIKGVNKKHWWERQDRQDSRGCLANQGAERALLEEEKL